MDLCCSTKLPLPTIPIVVIGDSLANRGVSLLCGHPVVFPMVMVCREAKWRPPGASRGRILWAATAGDGWRVARGITIELLRAGVAFRAPFRCRHMYGTDWQLGVSHLSL